MKKKSVHSASETDFDKSVYDNVDQNREMSISYTEKTLEGWMKV